MSTDSLIIELIEKVDSIDASLTVSPMEYRNQAKSKARAWFIF